MESVQRYMLLKQCFAKVIDTSVQSIGPTDVKHALPDYKDIGASLDGALMKAIGPSRQKSEEKFDDCCNKYNLDVKLGKVHELANAQSIDASVLDSDVLRQSEDFEVKMLEELIVQLEKANKSLRSRLTGLNQNINIQVASIASETHKYETIAGELQSHR